MSRIDIVIVTKNRGKLGEFHEIFSLLSLEKRVILHPLSDLHYDISKKFHVEETGLTFEENALIKARAVSVLGHIAIADDSGIMVDALGGAPGVRSARYAGDDATDEENNEKLLSELTGVPEGERGARFVAVIAISRPDGKEAVVRGECPGVIINAPRGEAGFGYDPIFLYAPLGKTYAEMTLEEKNNISHRRRAIEGLSSLLDDFLA